MASSFLLTDEIQISGFHIQMPGISRLSRVAVSMLDMNCASFQPDFSKNAVPSGGANLNGALPALTVLPHIFVIILSRRGLAMSEIHHLNPPAAARSSARPR